MKPFKSIALLPVLLSGCISMSAHADSANLPATGRKVVIEKSGERFAWKLLQAPLPTLGDDQVLVRVHAISLNRSEVSRLQSTSIKGIDKSPVSDAAGEVVAVGRAVKDVRKGTRVTNTYFKDWKGGPYSERYLNAVYGWSIEGVAAEYIVLDGSSVVPIPDRLSYEEASTLPTAAVTAWNAVMRTETRKGDVVLVQGTGGVSTFALQFAVALGANVIVTSSSDDKLAHARKLGAHQGIFVGSRADYLRMNAFMTEHELRPLIDRVYPIEQYAEALQSMASGSFMGKIVLTF